MRGRIGALPHPPILTPPAYTVLRELRTADVTLTPAIAYDGPPDVLTDATL